MFRAFAYLFIGLALFGWILFQLLVRKKQLKDIWTEVLFILFLLAVWTAIYYWALN